MGFDAIPMNSAGTFFVWYLGAAVVGCIYGFWLGCKVGKKNPPPKE